MLLDLVGTIKVHPFTLDYGPFAFDLSGIGVATDLIVSVDVKSVLDGTKIETTSLLLPDPVQVVGSNAYLKFTWPGSTYVGKHYIQFDITFVSGEQQSVFFGYAYVNE